MSYLGLCWIVIGSLNKLWPVIGWLTRAVIGHSNHTALRWLVGWSGFESPAKLSKRSPEKTRKYFTTQKMEI